MKTLLKSLILILVVKANFVLAQDAEFVWSEDDGNASQIYLSQHENGTWQPAEIIIDDSNLNILPTISSDNNNRRIVVWSVVAGDKIVLKYRAKENNNWSATQVLATPFSSNLGPTLIFDANDIGWMFWTANNGDDDDIYVSRFIRGIWSKPEMVNNDNDTPDILPEAGLDDNGNIWVSWQQLQENNYIDKTKSFASKSRRKMAAQNSISIQNIKQIKLRSDLINTIQPPASFKARSRATLHFPNDKKRTSKLVNGNLN